MLKVSIIVPLYNKAPYVEKALESILAQSFGDWECIIVDDGSTDNSGELADEFAMHNAQCMVIHQENSGVSAARNRGIAESRGEYIAFLDADDWWTPTFLEEMMQLAEDYPEAGIYASNYIYYKPGKTHVAINNIATGYFNYPKAYYESGAMPITSISVMIPRWVLCGEKKITDGFPVGVKLGEDFLTWSKIAMAAKVTFLNKPLAYYNNDIPATARATRNIHRPDAHMLWHLEELEEVSCQKSEDWTKLFSKLRAMGLVEYWLRDEYHAMAAEELKKVEWNKLDNWKDKTKYQRLYTLPRWIVCNKQRAMRLGSVVKQKIMHR